ncbi:3-methyl-2-oxobutanoate hydroxymethyltransferase, partial [Enterobacter quasiroggenkampii]|nr:3-methyl-2-oxobutanoate hydroxymethyltransferase [Enterobacter quasiroggenkampii]
VKCDGQVLVFHDIVRYDADYRPKRFVKTYADVGTTIREAFASYVEEVKQRTFPAQEHVFAADEELAGQLYGSGKVQTP